MKLDLKNKRVLLMGLGVLGGGINTARWLIKRGVRLTITDLKTEKQLYPSFKALGHLKKRVKFVLGKHREKDFLENEIIVVNPDVPLTSPYLKFAIKNKRQIENELSLFWKSINTKKIIAITGTRGKTTTANWIHHLIKTKFSNAVLAGNSPDKPLLFEIGGIKKNTPVVLETPSFLLEHSGRFNPKIAIITNIYRDHLNRYKNLKHYALTKANIFKNQITGDTLILNKKNKWTKLFLKQQAAWHVKSKTIFFSDKLGSANFDRIGFVKKWGRHNLENLSAAVLAAVNFGIPIEKIKKAIADLPQIKFRQELIHEGYVSKHKPVEIYNDTCATSPEATIVALERFGNLDKNLILISGGTDRNLGFSKWAKAVKKYVKPKNLILLAGSATSKMKKELKWKEIKIYENLEGCLNEAMRLILREREAARREIKGAGSPEMLLNEEAISALGKLKLGVRITSLFPKLMPQLSQSLNTHDQKTGTGQKAVSLNEITTSALGRIILFSPSSKSFEKFKNEFDRGRQFNRIVKKYLK